MFFTMFLVTAKREEDTYDFSFLKPVAWALDMSQFSKMAPQTVSDQAPTPLFPNAPHVTPFN